MNKNIRITIIMVFIVGSLLHPSSYADTNSMTVWDNRQEFTYWTAQSSHQQASDQIKATPSLKSEPLTVSLDVDLLRSKLMPGDTSKQSKLIYFPDAKGQMTAFTVIEKSNFSPVLAAKFPEISAFVGTAIGDPSRKIRFSVAPTGIEASITIKGNPATQIKNVRGTTTYNIIGHFDSAHPQDNFSCHTEAETNPSNSMQRLLLQDNLSPIEPHKFEHSSHKKEATTDKLSKYRLAVSANGQYTQYHGGSIKSALAAINTTVTHVNAIFERDFGLTLELVDNNDLIIYTDPDTDPYTDNPDSLNQELQQNLDAVIGSNNYDHGHIFSAIRKGKSGHAGAIGGFCKDDVKGSAWSDSGQPEGTQFTYLVAHEIGHQLGANHTFSASTEPFGTNVEPGSGSTVMSYGGNLGMGVNLVTYYGDHYFHHVSINQTRNYLQSQSCHTEVSNHNHSPVITPIPDTNIPISTPFILSGEATDEDTQDVLSYSWEQIDSGRVRASNFGPTNTSGANFRSLPPTGTGVRHMPKLSSVLSDDLTPTNPTIGSTWETLSSVPRVLNFGFTVRDNAVGGGAVAQETVQVNVVDNGGAFSLVTHNDGQTYLAGENSTIIWNVAGTDLSPILVNTVTISLSTDGGYSYPYTLARNVANSGRYEVPMPAHVTDQARIRITADNNIFYTLSSKNFSLTLKDIVLSSNDTEFTVCNGNNISTEVTYGTSSAYKDTAQLSANNLPSGLSVAFSETKVSNNNSVIEATIEAADDIQPNTYAISIEATSANRFQSLPLSIRAYSTIFSHSELMTPKRNTVIDLTSTTLTWKNDINAEQYQIEVALDTNFTQILHQEIVTATSYPISDLQISSNYFWRVTPINRCGRGQSSDTFSFSTPAMFMAEDLPMSISESRRTYKSIITIAENQRITDVNVFVDIKFDDIQQIEIYLTSPSNETVALKKPMSCYNSGSHIRTLFDDQAESFSCNTEETPGLSGRQTPEYGKLSRFNEESTRGNWVLTVTTGYTENPEENSIDQFALQITTAGEHQNYPPIAFDQSVTHISPQESIINLQARDPEASPLQYQLESSSVGQLAIFAAEQLGDYQETDQILSSIDIEITDDGQYAYLCCTHTNGESQISLIDISDPNQPRKIASEAYESDILHRYAALILSDDEGVLYVATGTTLRIYDVSTPTEISLLSTYTSPMGYSAADMELSADGETLFIADLTWKIGIMNVKNPEKPVFIGNIGTSNLAADIELSHDSHTAFAVDQYILSSHDISDLTDPAMISYLLFSEDTSKKGIPAYAISLLISPDGDTAFVATKQFGLFVIDISDPSDMKILGNISSEFFKESATTNPIYGAASGLALSPDQTTLYAATGSTGVLVVDVRNPEQPTVMDTIPSPFSVAVAMPHKGQRLYVGNIATYDRQILNYTVGNIDIYRPNKQPVMAGDIVLPNLYYSELSQNVGSDSFTFTVNDGVYDSNHATVNISITDGITSGGLWSYYKNDNQTITLTGCSDSCPSNLVIPEQIEGLSVTRIANHAFADREITSVTLPETITTIGNHAFYKNGLIHVTFGSNVTDIGAGAFADNTLSVASFSGDRPAIGQNAFALNRDLSVISYCTAKSDWPGAPLYNGFSEIVPTDHCNAASIDILALSKIAQAASDSNTDNLSQVDLKNVIGIEGFNEDYLEQYLIGIRLTASITTRNDLQHLVTSINNVMDTCSSSGYFVSVTEVVNFYSGHEVSWLLMAENYSTPLLSGGVPYFSFVCLADGVYTLNMYDSGGDGWIYYADVIGSFFSILSHNGDQVIKTTLATGSSGTTLFELGDNQAPSAFSQDIEVIRQVATPLNLIASDPNHNTLTRHLTKAPESGSLYNDNTVTAIAQLELDETIHGLALSNKWKIDQEAEQKIAYIANGTAGLTLVDIADPTNLKIVSALDTDGLARKITLSDDENIVYLSDGTPGLKIIDVSDPHQPTLLSTLLFGESVFDIALSNDGLYAYVVHLSGLSRVDISNPENPFVTTTVYTPGDAQAIVLSTDNQRAYVADGFAGVQVVDISQATELALSKSLDTDGEVTHLRLSPNKRTLYIADGVLGLKIIDVENTDNLTLISSVNNIGTVKSIELSTDGFTAYVTNVWPNGTTEMMIIDVSKPAEPFRIPARYRYRIEYAVPFSNQGSALASSEKNVIIFDLSYQNQVPLVAGDNLMENAIYLSDDSDKDTDIIEFVVNDGSVDSTPAVINILIVEDADGDRVADKDDAFPLDATESVDTDGDGVGNNEDSDDDNDGVSDVSDAYPLISLNGLTDTDGDGIPDNCDDMCISAGMTEDQDNDNDGVADTMDAFPFDATESVDTDNDGTGNNEDRDDDNDGVDDTDDAFPYDNRYVADSDLDGMPDAWEILYQLDPADASDANSDHDNDGVTALNEFLAGTHPTLFGSIDIDGNEHYDALTDGLLILRSMFSLTGQELVTGAVASNAVYTESTDITTRINALGDLLDIDGNGRIDALTDGLLILRYLFNLEGETLINGVIAADATRTEAEQIKAHLDSLTR